METSSLKGLPQLRRIASRLYRGLVIFNKIMAPIAVVAGIVVLVAWKTEPLPISIDIREGLLSHGVFQVRNLSDKPIRGRIHIENTMEDGSTEHSFVMDPYATNEFGRLEMKGPGLSKGSRGFISIEGYSRVWRFEIFDKTYYQYERLPVLGIDIPVPQKEIGKREIAP